MPTISNTSSCAGTHRKTAESKISMLTQETLRTARSKRRCDASPTWRQGRKKRFAAGRRGLNRSTRSGTRHPRVAGYPVCEGGRHAPQPARDDPVIPLSEMSKKQQSAEANRGEAIVRRAEPMEVARKENRVLPDEAVIEVPPGEHELAKRTIDSVTG